MSSPANVARLGALILALVFAGGSFYGAQYAAFALDDDTLESARSGNRPVEAIGFWRRPPDVKSVRDAWSTRDGMGGAARRSIALDTDIPSNVSALFVDVTKTLGSEPTNGWRWLEYTSRCPDDVMPRAGREGEERLRGVLGAKDEPVREEMKSALALASEKKSAKLPEWQRRLTN